MDDGKYPGQVLFATDIKNLEDYLKTKCRYLSSKTNLYQKKISAINQEIEERKRLIKLWNLIWQFLVICLISLLIGWFLVYYA